MRHQHLQCLVRSLVALAHLRPHLVVLHLHLLGARLLRQREVRRHHHLEQVHHRRRVCRLRRGWEAEVEGRLAIEVRCWVTSGVD